MPNPLEYGEDEEDDLFGSDEEQKELPEAFKDTRVAIGKSAASTTLESARIPKPRPPSPPAQEGWPTVDQRVQQLEQKKHKAARQSLMGAASLRSYGMLVLRRNAGRIWDIGGLEYSQAAELLDEMPREQLHEIEDNSPHIKHDTDWLWELFILLEYPLFHERCRERKGEPRTSGWRRMHAKAVADAEERKALAAERVANRYKQLEAERQSKRIVVMNEFVAPSKGRKAHSLTSARRGAHAAAAYAPPSKASTAMAKARMDSQRARVALTHASGKFVPPPPSRSRAVREEDMFKNPFNAPPPPVQRLPPPRVPRLRDEAAGREARPENGKPERRLPIYPTDMDKRAALPKHLQAAPSPPPSQDRFRIDGAPKRAREIHRPAVENFEVKPVPRARMDFFAPLPSARTAAASGAGKETAASPAPGSHLASPAGSLTGSPAPSRPLPMIRKRAPDESVLFAKKKARPVVKK